LPIGVVGHANSARFGSALQPSGSIDAVAKKVAALDHDVADMNTDPKVDLPVGRQSCIGSRKSGLCLDCALYGVYGTTEFGQYTVPSGIGNSTPVGADQAIKDNSPLGQIPECADLVGPHQTAVAGDVSRQYSCKSPLHPFSSQKSPYVRKCSPAYQST
jgi:hypothetical protein